MTGQDIPDCHRRLNVLIVDNVREVRQELALLLQLSGSLDVTGEAANGMDAIRQAEALHPDIVIMDLEMPIMDGYTATTRIKAGCPTCRVIALTIHGDPETRRRAEQAGVDGFVEKGASLQILLQAIWPAALDERNI